MNEATPLPWPYPRWIAHRGAGLFAPENTLAAFRQGASCGWRMFECDAQISADGVVFLMHDATLERTTNGHGLGCDQPWPALSRLDAGAWHSPASQGEPLPQLADLARFCLDKHLFLNIEIKPAPGQETPTGHAVAREAARLWQGATSAPLLTSFASDALAAAQQTAPHLPRGLLVDRLWEGWLEKAQELDCVAVVCNHLLCDATTMSRIHSQGMRCLCYTVNAPQRAEHLLALGMDGIITDRIDLFEPD